MIVRDDILSLEYLKKTEFTGCHAGMRYRIEKTEDEEGKHLKATVWPEPFNFFSTPAEDKTTEAFDFSEDGITDAVSWMNDRLFAEKEKWDHAKENWDHYTFG